MAPELDDLTITEWLIQGLLGCKTSVPTTKEEEKKAFG